METKTKIAHKEIQKASHKIDQKIHQKSNITYVLIGLVCLVLLFSAVQTIQITQLKSQNSDFSSSSVTGAVSANSPNSARQAAAQRPAPTMVGGC